MQTFPASVKILVGSTEQPRSVVLRTEMERGAPKQRRMASDTMVTVPATLFFETSDIADSFEDWFYSQINGGADWFYWTNPRTKTQVSARIVGGDIGTLQPATGLWGGMSTRKVTLEYLRSAY